MAEQIQDSSLTPDTTAVPAQEPATQAPTPSTAEPTPAGSQATPAKPDAQPFDYDWWKKDPRYGRVWKTDKDVFKSAYEADQIVEKQYKPLRAQAEAFTKLFKEYGYEPNPEKLKSAFDELKSWRDPENPTVKRANFFSYFYDHPEYKAEVEPFFENLRRKEIRKQFGEGVSDEIANEILENRKFREQVEREKREREERETHKKLVGTIEDGWKRVQSEAQKMGFPVTDEIKQNLLDHCAKEDLDPRFIFYKFQEMYAEEIEKHKRATIQSELTKSAVKQRKSGVIPAGTGAKAPEPASKATPSMLDRVNKVLGRQT